MLIEAVLPPGALGEDTFGDPAPTPALFPTEQQAIAHAGAKRRHEFTTTRHCAHRALARLGLPPTPLPPSPSGAPTWPPGITGSLTHCAGYRAAAVAHTTDIPHLGVDAEPHAPLPPSVRNGITSPTERTHLRQLHTARPDIHWDRLLFSAKESLYKACSPLAPRPLHFEDAEITFTPHTHTFTAHLLPHPQTPTPTTTTTPLTGHWHTSHHILVTAVTIPHTPTTRPLTWETLTAQR
ncbi:4'-phosphopantetheinyl transferase family protein [Streptomyces inhibens]|uniref:4'-phosphopantetheinyl transferase family protein n=1 Tax=Streptomyces inhibens TaxID=2293571 RepID=UPI002478FAA8|nr:4'-phosphopantetheinyl transferase superfamily protein [Streptomyces inhibens]